MNHVLKAYLEGRRSIPANALSEPGPDRQTIQKMLQMASRVPDHGKLAPWRFIVYSSDARQGIAEQLTQIALRNDPDMPEERLQQEKVRFLRAPTVIAVVSTAGSHPKIPEWEQILSAGAVCLNLFMAANALGFAANWLTEWITYDQEALGLLGVNAGERVAGFVYIGTPTMQATDRPRPDLDDITTWVE